MPSNASKLLAQMRNSKRGWKRHDLETLYIGFGFIIKSSSGPHDKVTHPEFPSLVTALPRKSEIAVYLVDQAINLVERLQALEQKRDEKKKP